MAKKSATMFINLVVVPSAFSLFISMAEGGRPFGGDSL